MTRTCSLEMLPDGVRLWLRVPASREDLLLKLFLDLRRVPPGALFPSVPFSWQARLIERADLASVAFSGSRHSARQPGANRAHPAP